MKDNDTFDLRKFDKYREDNRLEVKRAKEKLPEALWETYSSFANTNGGCIILGVKEKEDKSWYTTGLKDVSKLKKDFWDTIHNSRKVNICLLSEKDVQDYEINGDVILVINVPRARREEKPVYINNDMWSGTFRRDWEGDYHCTRSSILAMLRDQTDDTPDMKVLENKEIKDLDHDSIRSYRIRYNATHQGHPWCDLPEEEFLLMIGAASDETEDHRIHPTAAGLLMFGQFHRIIREFPEYLLDYREKMDPSIRWTDRVVSNSGEWSGNVYDFFTKVSFKLVSDVKKPFKLEGIYRIDDTPVHVAIREALANCLVNTDYFLPWNVVVEKYPDKIVLANPGTVRLGKKQMLRGGISQPRNRLLLNMFNFIGVGERAGSGVPDIYSIWKSEHFDDPIVDEASGREGNPDRTTLTLPMVENKRKKQAEKTSGKNKRKKQAKKTIGNGQAAKTRDNKDQIIKFISKNGSARTGELVELLGLSEARVRVLLSEMVDSNLIEPQGNGRSRRYVLKKV